MMPSHTFSSNLAFLIGLFSKCCRKLTSKKTANSSGNSKLIRKNNNKHVLFWVVVQIFSLLSQSLFESYDVLSSWENCQSGTVQQVPSSRDIGEDHIINHVMWRKWLWLSNQFFEVSAIQVLCADAGCGLKINPFFRLVEVMFSKGLESMKNTSNLWAEPTMWFLLMLSSQK
jgi:hypothetical protein